MTQPDFEAARQYALGRLRRELSPQLHYHSLGHTVEDVLPALERLAALEAVTGEELLLLRTAALYHDLGFIEQRAEHEAAGIRIMETVLPGFSYTPEQVAIVRGMILATKLPQSPRNRLEQIMADADLDVLGRDDFWTRHLDLRAEWAAFGRPTTEAEWYDIQLKFLEEHHYFTGAARALREAGKQQTIAELRRLRDRAQM